MPSDLKLDFGNCQQYPGMDSETEMFSIDQGGEWGKTIWFFLETPTQGSCSYTSLSITSNKIEKIYIMFGHLLF